MLGHASEKGMYQMYQRCRFVVLLLLVWGTLPLAAPGEEEIPPSPGVYMGRTIARTMHWTGAQWLMRATREEEEQPNIE